MNTSIDQGKKPKEAYTLSKKKYLGNYSNNLKAQPGRTFIYALFTNTKKGVPSRPFYIGQSRDVHQTLQKHSQIDWHFKQWKKPAIVHVIANIPDTFALKAEYGLIRRLSNKGFKLNNSEPIILNAEKLDSLSKRSVEDYLLDISQIDWDTLFDAWQLDWKHAESKKTVSNDTTELASYKIRSNLLIQAILVRKHISAEARNLSRRIASSYNEEKGTSTIVFHSKTSNHQKELLELEATFRQLRGDWDTKGKISLDKEMIFKPANKLVLATKAYIRKNKLSS